MFILGILGMFFVFIHWLLVGTTKPYQSLMIGSILLAIIGYLNIMIALLSDMIKRQNTILKEMQYHIRKLINYKK
jgi:pilus assembly protein TadC